MQTFAVTLMFCALTCLGITEGKAETALKGGQPAPTYSKQVPKLSAVMRNEIFGYVFAQQVAEKCWRVYALNEKQIDVLDKKFASELRKQGFTDARPPNLQLAIPDHEIKTRVIQYFRTRNLRGNNASSWCSAGQAEVAQKTMIGKYLIKK